MFGQAKRQRLEECGRTLAARAVTRAKEDHKWRSCDNFIFTGSSALAMSLEGFNVEMLGNFGNGPVFFHHFIGFSSLQSQPLNRNVGAKS